MLTHVHSPATDSPISIDRQAKGFFELLVRHYPRGEFSSQLARMEPGDAATFLGPVESRYTHARDATPRLGLIAAGTGITPMWQVIQAALSDPSDTTRISLVYASRSPEAILLKPQLDAAAANYPERLHVAYIVSELTASPTGSRSHVGRTGVGLPAGVQLGRIDEAVLRTHLPPPPDGRNAQADEEVCHVLVSGPDALLVDLCGPRARDGGVQQGPHGGTAHAKHPAIGGLLRRLGYRSNQVTWL